MYPFLSRCSFWRGFAVWLMVFFPVSSLAVSRTVYHGLTPFTPSPSAITAFFESARFQFMQVFSQIDSLFRVPVTIWIEWHTVVQLCWQRLKHCLILVCTRYIEASGSVYSLGNIVHPPLHCIMSKGFAVQRGMCVKVYTFASDEVYTSGLIACPDLYE